MATVSTFFDAVFVNATETSGLGPFTLGAALLGFQTAAAAGITNGTPVSYRATDGTNWETAHGVVNVSGSVYTLTRGIDTIKSSNSNALVEFGVDVVVLLTTLSQDLNALASTRAGTFAPTDQSGAGLTFTAVHVKYQVIGNMVFLYGRLTYPTTSSGLGSLVSTPFPVPSDVSGSVTGTLLTTASLSGIPVLATVNNTSTMEFASASPVSAYTNAQLSGATLVFSVAYPLQ